MGHDLSQFSSAWIEERILHLTTGSIPRMCLCDDFEVDDGVVIRRCAWNDYQQLEGELVKRDMAVAR